LTKKEGDKNNFYFRMTILRYLSSKEQTRKGLLGKEALLITINKQKTFFLTDIIDSSCEQ